MKSKWGFIFALLLLLSKTSYAVDHSCALESQANQACCEVVAAQGWSLDLGGQYTWMSLTTPPTFDGNTGGAHVRLTYQNENSIFGQIRSFYNIGSFQSGAFSSKETESYTELLGGYCFRLSSAGRPYLWSVTPYGGVGLDFLNDHKLASGSFTTIKLKYQIYYALGGLDIHYIAKNWSLGAQVDCFTSFAQYLAIKGLAGTSYRMSQRLGYTVRIPIAYRLMRNIWLEATPYYRLLPIGSSRVLYNAVSRDLEQWGVFATLRFFL
jgi:hypothetical protein